ncbi:hypothetical protein L6452_32151 [Arctium lappa]|uniref:Uncharacterized protein n=1 Tax=Arctium lappa TaxID=4217 RepID=A0ACB8Z462_ARCLA|nr:hypothetical protein L6452_32151 [Arctium lappa]
MVILTDLPSWIQDFVKLIVDGQPFGSKLLKILQRPWGMGNLSPNKEDMSMDDSEDSDEEKWEACDSLKGEFHKDDVGMEKHDSFVLESIKYDNPSAHENMVIRRKDLPSEEELVDAGTFEQFVEEIEDIEESSRGCGCGFQRQGGTRFGDMEESDLEELIHIRNLKLIDHTTGTEPNSNFMKGITRSDEVDLTVEVGRVMGFDLDGKLEMVRQLLDGNDEHTLYA